MLAAIVILEMAGIVARSPLRNVSRTMLPISMNDEEISTANVTLVEPRLCTVYALVEMTPTRLGSTNMVVANLLMKSATMNLSGVSPTSPKHDMTSVLDDEGAGAGATEGAGAGAGATAGAGAGA